MTDIAAQSLVIAKQWASEPFDADTRKEVQALIDANDIESIKNRFGASMQFGTAGLRGVMGAGRTMMNVYMIAKATKALAQCLIEEYGDEAVKRGVVVGYDCRHNSEKFALMTAGVLAANGIKVYLYDRLTPTNLVPFAIRVKKAFAGVMITSSHNPKVYNGYKVFWSNGAQIISPVDAQVASRMDKLGHIGNDSISIEDGVAKGLIEMMSTETIDAYTDWVVKSAVHTGANDVDIIYTPLGGTGWACAKASFDKAGFKKVRVVEEEKTPSGDFAGLDAPNPERPDIWPRALKMAKEVNAEIVLANDGDADRLGVAIPVGGEYKVLGGNQIGALMLNYIIEHLPAEKRNKDSFAICSVVSSPLTRAICENAGVDFQETLTGFKWMGNVADERVKRGQNFLFAYEEAFGFTYSDARDKDGIISVLLLAELAADCKARGKRVIDVLDEIYIKNGIHCEDAAERFYEGLSGKETMANVLANLRNNPPHAIAGIDVARVRDLLGSKTTDLKSGEVTPVIHLPKQDMLTFYLADNSWISLRPSGTEPKLKAYLGVIGHASKEEYPAIRAALETKLARIKAAVKEML
jgi:phosphomannomutase